MCIPSRKYFIHHVAYHGWDRARSIVHFNVTLEDVETKEVRTVRTITEAYALMDNVHDARDAGHRFHVAREPAADATSEDALYPHVYRLLHAGRTRIGYIDPRAGGVFCFHAIAHLHLVGTFDEADAPLIQPACTCPNEDEYRTLEDEMQEHGCM